MRAGIVGRTLTWAEENLNPVGPVLLVTGGATAYLAILAWAWQATTYDLWGAVLLAPILVALTIPIARRAARIERDPAMVRLVIGALALKLLMSVVRYAVAFGVYSGTADASVYDRFGTQLAQLWREGELTTLGLPFSGTGFIRILTGAVYFVTGPTKLGGFVVFAWLGFWGLYLSYRAFRLAVPDGDHRRYAALVFFLPSMLFWSSSIGKEAWMCLMLGIASYGSARMMTHRRGGFLAATAGIAGCAVVRPHIALLFFVGMAAGYVITTGRPGAMFGSVRRVLGVAVLMVGGVFLLDRVETFLDIENVAESTEEVRGLVAERTDEGGSAYEPVSPTSPRGFAWAVVTVLFRPFPNEATNPQSILAAIEGLAILGLCVLAAPRVLRGAREIRRRPYAILAVTFVPLFCYAFSSVGNFGIITRQRVQVLPFLLILPCLPVAPGARSVGATGSGAAPATASPSTSG